VKRFFDLEERERMVPAILIDHMELTPIEK
jgi:hypothetical protein